MEQSPASSHIELIATEGVIDTEKVAYRLRKKILNLEEKTILIAKLEGSDQEQDLSTPPNCRGYGRIRHFRKQSATNWPDNPLPIYPACKALSIPYTDNIEAQAFQNEACAWRCWYCFVPYNLLSGDERRGGWLTADQLLDFYLEEKNRPAIIDLTGGSPDLTPEWVIWMLQAIKQRGLKNKVYLWSDDNLSTDYLWTALSNEDISLMRESNSYGRVCCFKGFSKESFVFNTKAEPRQFELQFQRFEKMLHIGIDLYAYVTLTTPSLNEAAREMENFMDRLQGIHRNLPLRTVPLRIHPFTPVQHRLSEPMANALKHQDHIIGLWKAELFKRFSQDELALEITEVPLDLSTK